ncbi:MAG: ABC transporter ATP-binding protein [Gammaproteobacteria bacterium]
MTENALTIKGLSKVYKNKVVALDNIDLNVRMGDFFALLGPNGAGKSTLIGILTSLINKSAGHVQIMGCDIDTHFSAAKSQIGLVPQEFNFNSFEPLIEIIKSQAGYYGLDRRTSIDAAEDCLHKLELWDKRKHTPRELSGGMKRRLMIARALVHDPKLLILDEPTAGVDIEVRRTMWELLRKINGEGKTIILTTHYLEEAENLCKNIAIINHGKVIIDASMGNLLEKLNEESFILYLQQPLKEELELENFEFSIIDTKTIEVTLTNQNSLLELLSLLNDQDITISSIRNKSNKKEKMFIKLTSNNSK